MKKIINIFLLSMLFVVQTVAVEIINNTSKNITIHDVSFTDAREIWMFPLDTKPGEKKLNEDFASFRAHVSGVEGTYFFQGLDNLTCVSFIEFDDKITVMESKEEHNIILLKQHSRRNLKDVEEKKIALQANMREAKAKDYQSFKDEMRQSFIKIKSKIDAFDKEIDRDYNYGVKLADYALKIAVKRTLPDSCGITNEQIIQEAKAVISEYSPDEQRFIKVLNESNKPEITNIYNKHFLGFISVYENDEILQNSLARIGCPKEKIQNVIDSGNCEACLMRVFGAALPLITDCIS